MNNQVSFEKRKVNITKIDAMNKFEQIINKHGKVMAVFQINHLTATEMDYVRKVIRNKGQAIIMKNKLAKLFLTTHKFTFPEKIFQRMLLIVISDNVINAIGSVSLLERNILKLFIPVGIIDEGGFIQNPDILKKLINMQNISNLMGLIAMMIRIPLLQFAKALQFHQNI